MTLRLSNLDIEMTLTSETRFSGIQLWKSKSYAKYIFYPFDVGPDFVLMALILQVDLDTGRERLIRSHSSARFCFK